VAEGDGSDISKGAIGAIAAKIAAVILLPALTYIVLQTVSKPYYMKGSKALVGDQWLQTVFVINPGPWKTRVPTIEIATTTPIDVIDRSISVTLDPKDGNPANGKEVIATVPNGLPPGCNCFISYLYPRSTNAEPSLQVGCDGKPCKEAPTIDADVIMTLMIMVGAGLAMTAAAYALRFYHTTEKLRQERTNSVREALIKLADHQSVVRDSLLNLADHHTTLNAAVLKLVQTQDAGQSDVLKSISSLADFVKNQPQVDPISEAVSSGSSAPRKRKS
jgi:hypothetical protein